jgi:hypothetical protein
LPDLSWYNRKNGKNIPKLPQNVPNGDKIYQMAVKYSEWPQNIPNGHKIFQHFPFQGPPKYTQICIFGFQIYHLATLDPMLRLIYLRLD